EPVGELVQRLEQEIVLHAGQGIDRVQTVADQRGNDRFRSGHGCSRRFFGRCRLAGRPFALPHKLVGHPHSYCAPSVQIRGPLSRLPTPVPRIWRSGLTNRRAKGGCAPLLPLRRTRACIATAPIPAARFATPTSASRPGCPAGATASATMAACCSSICATITA